MSSIRSDIDPDGLLEYSVVFTDRSINHMSKLFQGVMTDISSTLRKVYNAEAVALVPGGGSYAMEAVARQLANGKKCLIIRNGWFSFRWSQIFDMGQIPSETIVLKARPVEDGRQAAIAPVPIEEAVAAIKEEKPDLVFAPHVETASGIILPEAYMTALAEAVHSVGGLFVLDCVASGTIWVDMKAVGVDVLISAPQKGWSASPCCGLVMLGSAGLERVTSTTSSSFACDLKKWLDIMQAYENSGHAYHATMPTDGLVMFRDTMKETEDCGLEAMRAAQQELGDRVRALLAGMWVRSERQAEDEGGSESSFAFRLQAPPVQLGQLLAQGQPDAGPFSGPSRNLVEAFENARKLRGGDSLARVLHSDFNLALPTG